MKTKLLTICLLLVTSQVFAYDAEYYAEKAYRSDDIIDCLRYAEKAYRDIEDNYSAERYLKKAYRSDDIDDCQRYAKKAYWELLY
ncbi:hypothetical protein OAY05_03350 [Gammaproteobacteria bacterium]|nr:hypothetical protein [Gammaproteobacteria bacterium]